MRIKQKLANLVIESSDSESEDSFDYSDEDDDEVVAKVKKAKRQEDKPSGKSRPKKAKLYFHILYFEGHLK